MITSSHKSEYENSLKTLLPSLRFTHSGFNFRKLLNFHSVRKLPFRLLFLFSTRSIDSRRSLSITPRSQSPSKLRIVSKLYRRIRLILERSRDCGSGHFSASLNLFTGVAESHVKRRDGRFCYVEERGGKKRKKRKKEKKISCVPRVATTATEHGV